MKRLAYFLLVVLSLLTTPAGAVRLDDKQSPQQRVLITPKPADEVSGESSPAAAFDWIAKSTGSQISLDTSAFVGKTAQIYLTLPASVSGIQGPSGLRLEWRTRGLFASGSTIPGQRQLIFQGIITQPLTTEFFDFTVHIDERYYLGNVQVEPIFELEPLSP